MATSIPTFKLDISEGMIDVNTSADRLYGYCIEASKGPVMVPTFCASSKEAKRIFGVDFLPHFYQNPTGIVICRVEFDKMATAKIEYKAKALKLKAKEEETDPDEYEISNVEADKFVALTVSSVSPGPCKDRVLIQKSKSGSGYNVSIQIDGVTSKTYQNVPTLEKVANKINTRFGTYLVARLSEAYTGNKDKNLKNNKNTGQKFQRDQFEFPIGENSSAAEIENAGYLTGGSNGVMRNGKGELPENENDYVSVDTGLLTKPAENAAPTAPNSEMTRAIAYAKAFTKIQDVDLIGIATIVDSDAVQSQLALHIDEVTDPEVHQLRFGITGATGYVLPPNAILYENGKPNTDQRPALTEDQQMTYDILSGQASILDSEWMIYIGQGVVFEDEYGNRRNVLPHEATQLYTGLRSALGYSEAIFGGETKKVLKGVVDTLPVVTDGTDIDKELIEDLNESGVCTFKKEYGEVTFVEGVTTVQDRDVLSYENMMSIAAYVSKRLIRIAKPYQGQVLTEDLKSTLTTALIKELKDITETDGTLMELEDFNILPYNVSVEAATKTMFDDSNNLIRVSKIIIKCRIVPVGALRDIDLGIIAI